MNITPAGNMLKAALAAAVFVTCTSLLSGTLLFGQNLVEESDNFHNTVYIKADDDAVKAGLFQFGEALRGQNPSAAVNQILRVLRMKSEALVPFGQRTYLSLREACLRRILNMDPDSRNLYLQKAGEEGDRLLSELKRPFDRELLDTVIARFPLTRAALRAMRMGGDIALEEGRLILAASYYRRYLEESALFDPEDQETAEVNLSLYIVLQAQGKEQAALPYKPSEPFYLAGKQQSLADLERLIQGLPSRGHQDPADWPTLGGDASRFRPAAFDCQHLEPVWHYPLRDQSRAGNGSSLDPITRRFLEAKAQEATVYPILHQGILYLFNERALYPLDLKTGNLIFGPMRWDWSLLFGDTPVDLESVTYAGTAHEGILYVALNHRIASRNEPAVHQGLLMALDLEREGYPLWMRGGRDSGDGPLEGVAFSGAPLVVEGSAFLLGTYFAGGGEARAEAGLYGFDRTTGALRIQRSLCSGAEIDRFEIRLGSETRKTKDRVELGAPLAEYGGILYCQTNLGVVGAVDPFSGENYWLFKYNRLFSQDANHYYRDYCLDTGGWKEGLPQVMDGRLYVTPDDSRFFYCLDLHPDPEGFLILDDPIEKGNRISLIGMAADRFYFSARESGRNFVMAMNRAGTVLWETPPFDLEDPIVGRALLTKQAIFIPTRRYLYRLDLGKEGLVTNLFPIPADLSSPGLASPGLTSPGLTSPGLTGQKDRIVTFGNIIASEDYLVSLSREDVIVFKGTQEGD